MIFICFLLFTLTMTLPFYSNFLDFDIQQGDTLLFLLYHSSSSFILKIFISVFAMDFLYFLLTQKNYKSLFFFYFNTIYGLFFASGFLWGNYSWGVAFFFEWKIFSCLLYFILFIFVKSAVSSSELRLQLYYILGFLFFANSLLSFQISGATSLHQNFASMSLFYSLISSYIIFLIIIYFFYYLINIAFFIKNGITMLKI